MTKTTKKLNKEQVSREIALMAFLIESAFKFFKEMVFMLVDYNKILNEFQYDCDKECWIRTADGKTFKLVEKDENDLARIAEISLED